MIDPTESPSQSLSEFIRFVLLKSNKKCSGCNLICFEDEHICPDCHGYAFIPYTEHLKNYSPEGQKIQEDDTEILESQLY